MTNKNRFLSGDNIDNQCKDCVRWSGIGFAENAGWCKKKDAPVLYNDKCDDDFEDLKKKNTNN